MQPNPVPSSTPASPNESDSSRFLIPRSGRLRFVLLFSLITGISTGISEFLVSFILRTWANNPDSFTWHENNIMLFVFLSGVVLGAFVGATQWLILRKYLLSWLWIVATCTGYVLSIFMFEAWNTTVNRISYPDFTEVFDIKLIIFSLILSLSSLFCYLWLGFAILIFLRSYVTVTWWWTFIPSAGIFFASLLIALPYILGSVLGHNEYLLTYSYYLSIWYPLQGFGIGAAEAIGLCTSRKKPINKILRSGLELASPLISAPEIIDLKLIQYLSKKLYLKINAAWKTDLSYNQELIYLVGVAEDEFIVTYQPINQAALDYLNETPLPDLVTISESDNEETANQQPLARFQVIFTPPAGLKVRTWRG